MNWNARVRSRFSAEEESAKWDRMYAEDTQNIEDEFFRLRCAFTIDYITSQYDRNAEICDLGCGAAPILSELLRRGYNAVGLDYSIDMLQHAADRIGEGEPRRRPLVRADVQRLPLRDESCDCAVCLGVISYVEDYTAIVHEIQRILKPGGSAIIAYRNEKNLMVSDVLGPVKYPAKKVLQFFGFIRRRFGEHLSFSEVRRVVEGSGLKIESLKGIGFGPIRLNHKPLLGYKASLGLHRAATWLMNRIGAELPFRIGADVHVLIVKKPGTANLRIPEAAAE